MTLNEKRKSWRPAGWENPHGTTEFTGHYQLDADLLIEADVAKAYEAGADAMLRALINQPSNIGANVLYVDELADGSTILHNFHRKGWLVFIPDEEYLLKPPHEG